MKETIQAKVDVEIEYSWKDSYRGKLQEGDKEHISQMVEDGMVEGEICSLDKENREHRGWWWYRRRLI